MDGVFQVGSPALLGEGAILFLSNSSPPKKNWIKMKKNSPKGARVPRNPLSMPVT